MGDKIVKSKNLCCQPVVFTRCSLLITPSIEGVSNDNAEVINKFTISHNTFEDKFDKLEKDTDEIMETMDKIEGKVKVILFKDFFFFFMKIFF